MPGTALARNANPWREAEERRAKREIELAKLLGGAEQEILEEAAALLARKDLTLDDVPPSLLVRRLLLCAFREQNSTAQQALKALLGLRNVDAPAPEEPEEQKNGSSASALAAALNRRDRGGLV